MDWNELSDDSWNQIGSGTDQQQQKTQSQASELKPTQQHKKAIAQTKQQKKQHQPQQKDSQKVRRNDSKNVRKFPSDEQILQDYEAGKVQDNRRLKILKCYEKEEQQMLESMLKEKKIMKLRNFKENFYIITFFNKDELIKFIKEKIEKSYKFKIAIYVETKEQKQWKAQKQKQRVEKRAKQEQDREKNKQHRDREKKEKYRQKQEAQQVKKQYRGDNESKTEKQKDGRKQNPKRDYQRTQQKHEDKERPKNDRKKEHSRQKDSKHRGEDKDGKHRGEEKDRKNKVKNIVRENERIGQITVLSDDGHPEDVVDWIKQSKIPKQYTQFSMIAAGNLFGYMQTLSQEIYKSLNFGLISDISQEDCEKNPQQKIKYVFADGKPPKQLKKNIAGVFVSKPSQECFDNVEKYNQHIIGKKDNYDECVEFDEKQYVQLFKKNYQKIVIKWQNWVFFAYEKNIAKLLRLSGMIKKLLTKNKFNYEVGTMEGVSFAKFQICDLNKTKFKVDTSVINSHLQNV